MEKSRFIQFSSLVGSVTKSIQSMKMEKMAHYGLSAAHTNLLCHLAESGEEGMTQGELAQAELTGGGGDLFDGLRLAHTGH